MALSSLKIDATRKKLQENLMEEECVERKLMLKWQKDLEISQEKILDMAIAQLLETRVQDLMEDVDRALVIVDFLPARRSHIAMIRRFRLQIYRRVAAGKI